MCFRSQQCLLKGTLRLAHPHLFNATSSTRDVAGKRARHCERVGPVLGYVAKQSVYYETVPCTIHSQQCLLKGTLRLVQPHLFNTTSYAREVAGKKARHCERVGLVFGYVAKQSVFYATVPCTIHSQQCLLKGTLRLAHPHLFNATSSTREVAGKKSCR